MKSFVFSVLALSLISLTACQSNAVEPPAGTQTVELGGLQARTTIQVPQDKPVATNDAPYALQGSPTQPAAAPTGNGYQAR